MKLDVLDTKINLFIEIDKSKLNIKEDETSRLILKTDITEDNKISSIIVIDFNKKYTSFIQKNNFKDKVLFIEGDYAILKNKKGIPYVNINATKVVSNEKKDIVRTDKLRNKLRSEFQKEDLKTLEKKYQKFCAGEEIKELIEVLKETTLLKEKTKLKNREIYLKELQVAILKREIILSQPESPKKIKWYENLDNFIDLDTSKIELSNEVFKKGNVNLDLRRLHDETKNNHVVVKKISEDKYELVMGIAAYCRSKILDKTVKALVTDLTRKEFVESLNK
jgi:hypothetical protein|nr:MAG: hypothetical protein [Bacteriophage sp.]